MAQWVRKLAKTRMVVHDLYSQEMACSFMISAGTRHTCGAHAYTQANHTKSK